MTSPDWSAEPGGMVQDGDIAVLHCSAAFTFAPGNRMRAARCLICSDLIGGQYATVLGAATLAGDACDCGGVASDVFLVHAGHLPMPAEQLQAAISRGLHCATAPG